MYNEPDFATFTTFYNIFNIYNRGIGSSSGSEKFGIFSQNLNIFYTALETLSPSHTCKFQSDTSVWTVKKSVDSLALEELLMVHPYMVEMSWTRGPFQNRMAVGRPPTLTITICALIIEFTVCHLPLPLHPTEVVSDEISKRWMSLTTLNLTLFD